MTEKTKKLYIKTHGCQMNEYDSSRIQDLLGVSHGLEPTDNPDEADVLLLNTCSIREKAQEKVFHQLGRWRKLKENNPDLIIGVGGCVASQEGADIGQRAPYVDVIFGPQTLHRVPDMLNARKADGPAIVDVTFPEIEKFDSLPEPSVDGPSAFVSIMEGCSKYCTFCVVPYTRGEEVSRPFDDVIAEVAQLAAKGVREVNLLGQNVNAYRGENHEGEIVDFAELLGFVAQVPGIDRIRYTTSHPVEFSDALIDAYRD
ncbi:MAG: tRNA (N6-isopentenyl adenosine(37)-C2)-methylthiotransferase MiaB, partial [Spongiibacter sp.]